MAQREQMYHQDLRGVVMRQCHLSTAGENVAAGYPGGRSVVNDGWMHSAGRRANILRPSFSLMGIGARKGHNGRWYVAQVFGHRASFEIFTFACVPSGPVGSFFFFFFTNGGYAAVASPRVLCSF